MSVAILNGIAAVRTYFYNADLLILYREQGVAKDHWTSRPAS
jgi:hypothetical protein